jgi:hypothetical protein
MDIPELEVIDVERDGRWSQVLLMEASSAAQARSAGEQVLLTRDEAPYVAVISADLGAELPEILAGLRPGLQEIVCFDSVTAPVVGGDVLAFRALEELAFGQDFVYTVPTLEGAVDHAVDTLLVPGHGGWEGRFVVVLGPRPVVERARRHLVRG